MKLITFSGRCEMLTDSTTDAIAALMKDVTKGPWRTHSQWNVEGPEYEIMNGSIMVRNDLESEANAAFIAAARDLVPALVAERDALLDALQVLVAMDDHGMGVDDWDKHFSNARAAIAKCQTHDDGDV